MKIQVAILCALCLSWALWASNNTPLLVGGGGTPSNSIQFPESTVRAYLQAASGALTIAAGGTNQNIILTPTGTGYVHIVGVNAPQLLLDNAAEISAKNVGGTIHNLLTHYSDDNVYLDNPDGFIDLRPSSGAFIAGSTGLSVLKGSAASYAVDVTGDVNVTGIYRKGGVVGVGSGSSITVCTSGACATTCTLIFNGGIRTGGTCP